MFLNIVKEEFCREETRIWTKNTQIYINISSNIPFKIINEYNWMKFSLGCDEDT